MGYFLNLFVPLAATAIGLAILLTNGDPAIDIETSVGLTLMLFSPGYMVGYTLSKVSNS